jgi:uncharacterized protein (DUF433 family)
MDQTGRFTNGVYTVSEICRILQPEMTARKVHYWLDTGLLSPPVIRGRQGIPTILDFQQLLEIRTVQFLRDELDFSLRKIRRAFGFILENLFADSWVGLKFFRLGDELGVMTNEGESMIVPGGQGILPFILPTLNQHVNETRRSWDARIFDIPNCKTLVTNARVQAGSPIVRGTRLETAFIGSFVGDEVTISDTVKELTRMYPQLPRRAVKEALRFEGVDIVAAS